MAPKSAPFKVVVHYSGTKNPDIIKKHYLDFYIEQVRKQLTDSNLCDQDKKAVIDRLMTIHAPIK